VVSGGPAGEFDMPAVRDVITTFAPDRGELIVDESILDLAGPVIDAPAPSARPPRRRPRWSRHGKGGGARAGDGAGHADGAGPADGPGSAPDDNTGAGSK
jgi:hypothetical protein